MTTPTEQKHTPGPWVIDEAPSGQMCVTARRAWICGQILNQGDMPVDEAEANARLIAAAPDLLAALIAVKDAEYIEGAYQPTVDMVDAAIAAATAKGGV